MGIAAYALVDMMAVVNAQSIGFNIILKIRHDNMNIIIT
ncbi:hypothetical protein SALWKB12_0068 [Snodgrassella communis]|nr:hypothetical protein SALWKB12_0068 [Snodgrassella communis]